TSDDHGMRVAVGEDLYAGSKTTEAENSGDTLLYQLHRASNSDWTSIELQPGPDDQGATRPTSVRYDGTRYVGWSRNQSPTNAVLVEVTTDTLTPGIPVNVLTGDDWRDGLFMPASVTEESGLLMLAHSIGNDNIETVFRLLEEDEGGGDPVEIESIATATAYG